MNVRSAPALPIRAGAPREADLFYHEREFGKRGVKVLPGEYFVASDDVVLTTVLGSCVSACIWDPRNSLGGMNHFLLPEGGDDDPSSVCGRYGTFAMGQLLGELVKRGARKADLEAKVFGGGHIMKSFTIDVGRRNADFVLSFLSLEGIRVVSHDLLDVHPRRVAFFPSTGRALCKKLTQFDAGLAAAEQQYSARLQSGASVGDVELF